MADILKSGSRHQTDVELIAALNLNKVPRRAFAESREIQPIDGEAISTLLAHRCGGQLILDSFSGCTNLEEFSYRLGALGSQGRIHFCGRAVRKYFKLAGY